MLHNTISALFVAHASSKRQYSGHLVRARSKILKVRSIHTVARNVGVT